MTLFSTMLKVTTLSACILAGHLSAASAQATPVAQDKAAVETIVRDYLNEHPEVIIEAIQNFQRQQQAAQFLETISLYRGYLENDPDYPALGNPNGDVTIVEFFDYRCGFCRRHYPAVSKLVESDGNIRFVPRTYPVLDQPGQPAVSRKAAIAALAAHKQGKFEAFHSAVLTSDGSLTEDRIYQIAASIGLNVETLKSDMRSSLLNKTIENTLAIGRDIGFTGTPSYIIGDEVILGAEGYDALVAAVNRTRKKQAQGR